jgi:hypothetical protein
MNYFNKSFLVRKSRSPELAPPIIRTIAATVLRLRL